ncbi:MAG: glycosyltransferase [Candidatus Aminicenantes bacterium]|nr:glycosyltransferase [Candidatus Aminicenantes bacterium]
MKRLAQGMLRLLPDAAYVRLLYLKSHGRWPDLRRPRTFDEKLQWYKLHYRDLLMTTLTDKYAVRGWLESEGHGHLLNELYGVYDRPEEIDPDSLPERFVIKATHGSSMNIICRHKRGLNWDACCSLMRRWLRSDYYRSGRQWAYKGIRPRLVCEKYLENEEFGELLDYKFYCYGGKPEVLWVCSGRYGDRGLAYNAYDMDWNRIHVFKGRPAGELAIEKPENYGAMVATARELCGNFPFIRVDLFSVSGKLVFGEFTFYPDSGTVPFTPPHFNAFFGDLFILPDAGHRPPPRRR